jgi:hypothetical protein
VDAKKGRIWLITCCPLAHTPQPYLYNSTLISLQLDLWLIWTLSHNLCLFELLTWSYSDHNSTWSPPQQGFQLNRIPYPWTLLGLDLAYPGLDTFLLKLKALIPLWTWTPSQFRLVSSIFSLSSPRQLTRVTFTLSAYPNLAWTTYPNFIRGLTRSHQCLPSLIRSYPAKLPYPILLSIGLLPTWSYPATVPDFLAQLGNTSLHPTTYPALPNHLARPGTLQLASPKNFLISLPPWRMLILADNASR